MGRIALAIACTIIVPFSAWCSYESLRWGRKGQGGRRGERFGIGHRKRARRTDGRTMEELEENI